MSKARLAGLIAAVGMAMSVSAVLADGTRTPAEIISGSVQLQPGDAGLVVLANNAPMTYVPSAGEKEFTQELIVRPLQPEALIARGMTQAQADAQVARALARVAPLVRIPLTIHKYVVITVPAGVTENQFNAFLMGTGDYEYAEPNWMCYPVAIPNDPSYGSQYAHQRVNSEPAWEITTGSASVTVGITDTGIQLDHEDLVANRVPGANSASGTAVAESSGGQVADLNGHGSHCSGIADGAGNNGRGIAGMAWNNKVMMVRVSDSSGGGSSLAALQAGATYAASHGCRVVSTSYSGVNSASNQTVGATMRTSFNALWFWAAGNANSNLGADSYPDIQIVMSTDSNDAKSSFSNYGDAVDIAAPGSSIFSCYRGSSTAYTTLSGTSMASPAACGVAGLIVSVNPALTAVQVRDILFNNADDLGAAGDDNIFGRGRVNSGKSIADAYRISFPLNLPFSDDFEVANFTNSKWVYRDTGTSISAAAVNEPSGTRSANVNLNRRIETNALRLAGNSQDIHVRFKTEGRGPASGEQLVVEYLNSTGAWTNLTTISHDGTLQSSFISRDFSIPNTPAARHNKFAVRFRSNANSAADNWYIDDVFVGVPINCPADFNGDNQVDFFDYLDFAQAFNASSPAADFNGDNQVDFFDYLDFASAFDVGCQ
jgi:subtilisin family serine protease